MKALEQLHMALAERYAVKRELGRGGTGQELVVDGGLILPEVPARLLE